MDGIIRTEEEEYPESGIVVEFRTKGNSLCVAGEEDRYLWSLLFAELLMFCCCRGRLQQESG
jgi:hypothetical protein